MNMMVSAAAMTAAAATVAEAACVPDQELLALGTEYERLIESVQPLCEEKSRLWEATHRRRAETFGIDPDDPDYRDAIKGVPWDKWNGAWDTATKLTGYPAAYDAWNAVREVMGEVAKKIAALEPTTFDGLMVRVRAIEHDEYEFESEQAEQLFQDLWAFAERQKSRCRT